MLPMRQSYRIIPIYTADVSGVCSALYELGGMTVMHDPSGCNSTYNTHDEIRWYDQDSLIFISGLTEIDAILGNDRKFINDIEHAARELHPKFIALAGSPIPFMNGTDFPAIAKVIETETGIPAFSACVWLPGVLTCFISLGGHIRLQSGADTPPACCTARKCDIRPQRKFARSKVLKIAFIVVCSLPFKISTRTFPLTY